MTRRYTAAAAAALLMAGLASAQQAPKPAEKDIMTLNREGQSPRRCKVLRSWKHSSGGMAYEVKAEDNGEILTVIEQAQVMPSAMPMPVKSVPVTDVKTAAMPTTNKVSQPAPPVRTMAAPKPTPVSVAMPIDPIMSPATYSGDRKVSQATGSKTPKAAPTSSYTKQPIPAGQRWAGRKDEQAAKAAPKTTPTVPVASKAEVVVEARAHTDPVFRLIGALKDDMLPSLREIAAEELARTGKGREEVTDALVSSAKGDMAPSVRACCCRCLSGMKTATPECLAALHTLTADADPAVRAEAAAALVVLDVK